MTFGATDRVVVERFVEQALFGPLDLTIRAVQELPAAADRARRQLVLARFIGKLAVDQGLREVRRRLDLPGEVEVLASVAERGPSGGTTAADPGTPVLEVEALDGAAPDSPVPAVTELALPDYEQLPAAHIVAKLAGLQQSDRDAIEVFESNHRHRRTILGKLDQLRGS